MTDSGNVKPFLERFYASIFRKIGDAHESDRLTKANLYQQLTTVNQQIFDQLIGLTLPESTFFYAEAEIVLEDGVSFYRLPPGFRQFLRMETRNTVTGGTEFMLGSKSHYGYGRGIEILSGNRGFRLYPPPILSGNQTWIMKFLRGPGLIHHARAKRVGDKIVVGREPDEDAGELVRVNDYYNGLDLRICDTLETGEILNFDATTLTFHLRHSWDTVVGDDVCYEVCPCLPYPYDSIFACDVAIEIMSDRPKLVEKIVAQLPIREKAWNAAVEWVVSNVADRPPKRIYPPGPYDLMPDGEGMI